MTRTRPDGGGQAPALRTIVALLAASLFLARCGSKAVDPAKGGAGASRPARKVPVQVATVATAAVTYAIDTVGSLAAQEVIRIPARVAGVVQDVTFQEGSAVTKDRVLLRIDPERYRLATEKAEAAVRQAEAAVKEAEAALGKRKALHAMDPGWVTDEEMTNLEAKLETTRAGEKAAAAALDLAKKDERDAEVRTGIEGVIDQKLVDTGQYVQAGTPVATVIDARRIKLAFKVSESESARLRQDSGITFRVKGTAGKAFRASLYHVGQATDPATRMVECFAWADDPGHELRPGSFADVSIAVGGRVDAPVVSETAVLPTDRGFVTWVRRGEEDVERRDLRLGMHTEDGRVEVLEGLRPGEEVVVRGGAVLYPGAKIAVEASQGAAVAPPAKPAGGTP